MLLKKIILLASSLLISFSAWAGAPYTNYSDNGKGTSDVYECQTRSVDGQGNVSYGGCKKVGTINNTELPPIQS